jgi:threonyl-tRNA synthetase
MYLDYFKLFGFEKYMMRYSTHSQEGLGKKYVNSPELWKQTEDMVLQTMKSGGINYTEIPGEAAFYGPKIDVQIWSAIGREFTLATNQVDFAVPEKFNLKYRNEEGKEETPICIHRAPLGTHERFIGFLIEHYAGSFPLWLAPVQIKVLTVTGAQNEYAAEVYRAFKQAGLRVQLDTRNEKIGFKVREAVMHKVPYMAIIGNREMEGKTLSLRLRSGKNIESVQLDTAVSQLSLEMLERRACPVFE